MASDLGSSVSSVPSVFQPARGMHRRITEEEMR